jgi:hypothetical protein
VSVVYPVVASQSKYSITVQNKELEEKRQQHVILYRFFQTIDESEQANMWWFRRRQIFVHGSEGKSSIIVHQGFSRIMMKNVAINISLFDYYLYMNFICACIIFCSNFFFVFIKCFVVDSLTFFLVVG